jgi:hypothetical protein
MTSPRQPRGSGVPGALGRVRRALRLFGLLALLLLP